MRRTLKSQANDSAIYSYYDGDWRAQGNKLSALEKLNPWRFRYFDRLIPRWRDLAILDIGCGAGFTAEFLAKRGARISGLDPSEAALRTAAAHAKTQRLHIEYRQGNAECLPYPDRTFDVVVCVDVLEHIGNLEKALREAGRVLKPGGYLLFDTINKTFLSKIILIWLLEHVIRIIPCGAHDWNMFIAPEHLRQSLKLTGFGHIQISGFPVTSVAYIGIAQRKLD